MLCSERQSLSTSFSLIRNTGGIDVIQILQFLSECPLDPVLTVFLGHDPVSELRAEDVNQVAERHECPGSSHDDVGDGFVSSLHLPASTCGGWTPWIYIYGRSRQHAECHPFEEGGEEGRHLLRQPALDTHNPRLGGDRELTPARGHF